MKTIKITKEDLDKNNFYKEDGIGTYSNPEDCSVEIDGGLGWVRFKKGIYVSSSITARAGSGIEAGEGITAGSGIEAGEGITAGSGISAGEGVSAGWSIAARYGISAGWDIKARYGISAGWDISAGSGITAGEDIEAGRGIEAGSGITAGWGIEAGRGITAGWGIEAGRGITSLYSHVKAKLGITFESNCTLSAGIFSTSGEKEIEATKIIGGKVIYGKVTLLDKEEKVEELTMEEVCKELGRNIKIKK